MCTLATHTQTKYHNPHGLSDWLYAKIRRLSICRILETTSFKNFLLIFGFLALQTMHGHIQGEHPRTPKTKLISQLVTVPVTNYHLDKDYL